MTRTARLLTIAVVLTMWMVGDSLSSVTAYVQGAQKTKSKAKSKTSKPALEIRKDKKGQYRFFYMGKEGKTLAMCSKGYDKLADARKAIDQVKKLIRRTARTKSGLIYGKDKKGQYRFYVKDAEGTTLAMGVQGFKSQPAARKVADAVKAIAVLKPVLKR